jgi:uncharacterized protein (DUF885 family)
MQTGVTSSRWLAVAFSVALLAACGADGDATGQSPPGTAASRPAQSPPVAESAAWNDYVARYIEDYFVANPVAAVYAGRHEFDGRMDDFSAAAIGAEVTRLRAERTKALAFDASTLSDRQRFERDYLVSRIDRDLFWLAEAQWPFRDPSYYTDYLDPDPYLNKPYAPLDQRMRAYIAYAKTIPRAAAQIRANLRTPLPAPWIEYGVNSFGGFAEFYENDVTAVYAGVANPELQAELKQADTEAAAAMRGLVAWLESERPRATADFALGAAMFSRMLEATEDVKVPLDRLEAIGRADLERNTTALRAACGQFLPQGTVAECVARVRAHKPDGGSVAAATRQLTELEAFVRQADLVTIPSDDRARVAQAPPYNAQNFAYIQTPGPFEKGVPATYYIAAPDPKWSAKERAEYTQPVAGLLFISAHEVWPGHFLHFLHVNRSASKIGQLFTSYAFTEGWAHYTEEMMWDAGLHAGDPEAHVGQLLQALWRDSRYVSAIGMHTGRMTLAESEKMFREVAYLDAGNARQQALRGTYDPAYLNYTLGKLMIRKLREDWTASRGGRAAWKQFHDTLLSFGGPPLPLVRREMLGPQAGDPL